MSNIDPLKNTQYTPPPEPSLGGSKSIYSETSFSSGSGSGSGWGGMEKILGKKDAAMFKANLCNAISQQITHNQKRAKKAAERLRKSISGQNMYDS
jgi:hypothetical protein